MRRLESDTTLDNVFATGRIGNRLVMPIRQHPFLAALRPARRAFDGRYTSQQHNTHIVEVREVWYPWHAWFGRKVRVHATLMKRGVAVAHCSSEDVHPHRLLELPLWMLDSALCCQVGQQSRAA
jgi:hypothetical protein